MIWTKKMRVEEVMRTKKGNVEAVKKTIEMRLKEEKRTKKGRVGKVRSEVDKGQESGGGV